MPLPHAADALARPLGGVRSGAVLLLAAILFTRLPAGAEERTWMMDLDFDRPQQISMAVIFEAEQGHWYLTYKVTNNTSRDRYLLLKIWLVVNGDAEKRTYPDRLMPALERAAEKTFDTKFDNRVEMMGKLGKGESKTGVALFGPIGFDIKTVDVYIDGLSKKTLLRDDEGRPYFLKRRIKAIYNRMGDPESEPYTVLIKKRNELDFVEEKISESVLEE